MLPTLIVRKSPHPHIHIDGDTALERVNYTATIWPGDNAPPIEDAGKGIHVYRRQPNGSWKLTYDIWNSDQLVSFPPFTYPEYSFRRW